MNTCTEIDLGWPYMIEIDEADGIEGEIFIYYNSKFVIGTDIVHELGKEINAYICKSLTKSTELVVNEDLYNKYFQKIIKKEKD